jgi:hypothetical protein
MVSLVAALGAKYPDSQVLFDDTFEDGFCGWQSLYTPSGQSTYADVPLGLYHPSVGSALTMWTNSANDPGIGSQGVAMKRLAYYDQPGIVDFEVWFAFGGESPSGASPKYIQFMVDEMYGGQRHFWKARWRNFNTITNTRDMDWYLSSQAEDTYVSTGGVSDFPFNGGKGSLSHVKLTIDLANRQYLSLQANRDTFDLSTVPGVTAPGADGNSTFDDPLFENGLNFMVSVQNRDAAPLSAWVAVQRTRAIHRSA